MEANWTEEQITVVLYEYCRRPFGQFSGTKPFIEELGHLLHRSPGAIVRKVGNLAHFDPQMKARGVGGLEYSCCITGLNNPTLLQARHIVGWSKDEENRTNPQNGLCLNVLFHKAYDDNLLGISPDYEVFVSERFFGEHMKVVEQKTIDYIRSIDHRKLTHPHRFYPNNDFLAMHYENFKKM